MKPADSHRVYAVARALHQFAFALVATVPHEYRENCVA